MARTKNLDENINAFLDLIAWSEGTLGRGDDGYNIIVGGSEFHDYSDHPRQKVYCKAFNVHSSAAGRYQILERYFDHYKKLLNLKDFSPESQDAIAIQMIKERSAYNNIKSGLITMAIKQCSNIWASFPGNSYGQKAHAVEKLLAEFSKLKLENKEG